MLNLNINPGNEMAGFAPAGAGGGSNPSAANQSQMLMMMMQMMMQLMTMFMGGMGGGGGALPSGSNFGSPQESSGLNNFLGGGGGGGGSAPVGGGGGGYGGAPVGGGGGSDSGSAPVGAAAPTQPVTVNGKDYAFPVQGYGESKVPLHHGSHAGAADLFAPRGTPVVAMLGGTVTKVGNGGAGGNTVTIKGDDGNEYYYAHLEGAAMVKQGQRVERGQQLGGVGDSGNAKGTGTHLHLGVGPHILNGTGPAGGAGSDGFNLNGLLNQVLANGR